MRFESRIKKKIGELNPLLISWNKYTYFVFFILIPLIQIFIYLIPQGIKNSYFILFPSNPNFFSIFLSNYTHSEFNHILSNLVGYLIIMFLLFNLETNKKRFYLVSVLLFLLLPFCYSFVAIRIGSPQSTQGFSTILSGFIGYLIYPVYSYLKNVYKLPLNGWFPSAVIIINFAIVGIFNLPNTSPSLKLILEILFVIFTIYIAYIIYKSLIRLKELKQAFNKLNHSIKTYRLSVTMVSLIFLFYLPFLIPSQIIQNGLLINVLAHYLGYFLGCLLGHLFMIVADATHKNVRQYF